LGRLSHLFTSVLGIRDILVRIREAQKIRILRIWIPNIGLPFQTVAKVTCLQNCAMFRSLGWDLCEPDVCHDLRLGLHHALQHPRKLFTQLATGIEADADGIGIPASQVWYRSNSVTKLGPLILVPD
jgi:hypothetical protein